MKFSCSVEIDQPLEKVVEFFDNPDNLKEWQDGFISLEHLSGTPGMPGAKSRLKYKAEKREIELIETIEVKTLPKEFTALYETSAMVNTMTTRFISLDENCTRYEADIHYKRFNGIMPKLMATFMPGMFKRQVQKWMDQFKVIAETDPS